MKINIGMILSCAAVLLLMPLPCRAQETFSYTLLEDGTASVVCEDKSIVQADIPSTLDGYPVTELAESCFSGCDALETVNIPDTVTSIQSYAFEQCVMLSEIDIPASVTEIGDFAFEGCLGLECISVDADSENYSDQNGVLFKNGESMVLMRYPQAMEGDSYCIPDGCGTLAPWSFTDCTKLNSIDLTGAEAIGADAFMGCTALESVTFPEHLTELIGAAFANCGELRKAELPEDLTSIGDRCFYGCVNLREVSFPDTLTSIGERAFFGCRELKEITLPVSVEEIGEYGIGYSVDQNGDPAVIDGVKLNVDFSSKAYSYARKNGIPFHAEIPKYFITMILVCILLVSLLVVGIVTERKRRMAEKEQEKYVTKQNKRNDKKQK